MVAVKIHCDCGQHYSFDVEPVHARMPSQVNCPACGADGTAAANEVIARHLVTQSAAQPVPSASPGFRVATVTPAVQSSATAATASTGLPSEPSFHPRFAGKRGTKKKNLFSRIESRDDALKVTSDASSGFLVMAGIQAVGSIFVGPSILIDAVIWAVLAGMLRAWKSRVVAILLLLMSLGVIVVTILNRMGVTHEGGGNLLLVGLMLLLSVRAVQATFLLRGRFTP